MLVNHGPSQQSSKEEYKPWKRDATARYYASRTKTVTDEEVSAKIQLTTEQHEDLLTIVKKRKLQWYGHVSRSSILAKTILQGTVKGGKDKADSGRGGKTRSGNGQAWSSLSPRGQWRTGKMEETGCEIICAAPMTLAVKR